MIKFAEPEKAHKVEIYTNRFPENADGSIVSGRCIRILIDGLELKWVKKATLKMPGDGVLALELELLPTEIVVMLEGAEVNESRPALEKAEEEREVKALRRIHDPSRPR